MAVDIVGFKAKQPIALLITQVSFDPRKTCLTDTLRNRPRRKFSETYLDNGMETNPPTS